MNYRCEDKGKDLGKNYCPCDDPKWDRSEFTETIQTKFQLICEKKKLISMCHSVLYFGALVGSFTVGAMADK